MKQQKFSKSEIIEEQSNVFTDIKVNALIKFYYAENVAFKRINIGDAIPFDQYFEDLPYISPFLMRLIKNNKGKFYLKNDDCDSLDYILALFSCFEFINPHYIKLFEMKMLKWEQNKKRT